MLGITSTSYQFGQFRVEAVSETQTFRGSTVTTNRVDSEAKLSRNWAGPGEWIGLWKMIGGLHAVGKVLQKYDDNDLLQTSSSSKKSRRLYPHTYFDVFVYYVDKNGGLFRPASSCQPGTLMLRVGIGDTCIVAKRTNGIGNNPDDNSDDAVIKAYDLQVAQFLEDIEKDLSKQNQQSNSNSSDQSAKRKRKKNQTTDYRPKVSNVLIEYQKRLEEEHEKKSVPTPLFVGTGELDCGPLWRGVKCMVNNHLLKGENLGSYVLANEMHQDVVLIREWVKTQSKGKIRCYIRSFRGYDYDFEPTFVYQGGHQDHYRDTDLLNQDRGTLFLKQQIDD